MLFQDEVKSIVKKRTDFEYILKRRELEPSDYYGYITYELNLDTLRDLRSGRITNKVGAEKELKDAVRNLEANFFRHICYVFERGLRRFPAEASLWADYVQFLKKKKSTSVLNTVLGRALALFPKNEQFWIEAAAHELSDNNSTHAARLLFQRGLRVNKTSTELWKRYFELELWNVSRIKERQKILEIQPSATAEDEEEEKLDETEAEAGGAEVPRQVTAPLVVFKYATAAVPGDLSFALEMYFAALNVSSSIAASILDEFKQKFSAKPQFWAELATRSFSNALQKEDGAAESSGSNRKRKDKTQIVFISTLSGSLVRAGEILQEGVEYLLSSKQVEEPQPKRRKNGDGGSTTSVDTLSRFDECLPMLSAAKKCLSAAVSSLSGNVFPGVLFDCDGNAEKRAEVLVATRVAEKALESICSVMQRIIGLARTSTATNDSFECCLVQCRVHLGVIMALLSAGKARATSGASLTAGASSTPAKKGAKQTASASTSGASTSKSAPVYTLPVHPLALADAVNWVRAVPVEQLSARTPTSPDASRVFTFGSVAYEVLSYLWRLKSAMVQAALESRSVSLSGDNARAATLWRFLADAKTEPTLLTSIDADVTRAVECITSAAVCGSVQVAPNTDLLLLAYRALLNQYSEVDECDDDGDDNGDVTADEPADSVRQLSPERFASLRGSLQSVIKSQYLAPGPCVAWMCAYVKLGYGLPDALTAVTEFELGAIEEVDVSGAATTWSPQRGREHLAWVLGLVEQQPGLLHMNSVAQLSTGGADSVNGQAMQSIFGLVLQLEGIGKSSSSQELRASSTHDLAFRRSLVEQALLHCPGSAAVTRDCETFLRAAGEHKLANHAKWRAKTAASGTSAL